MKWIKTDDPNVWEASDGIHFAQVRKTGGYYYQAQIYARPVQLGLFEEFQPEPVKGAWSWGSDENRALRLAVHRFDKGAELPEGEFVWP